MDIQQGKKWTYSLQSKPSKLACTQFAVTKNLCPSLLVDTPDPDMHCETILRNYLSVSQTIFVTQMGCVPDVSPLPAGQGNLIYQCFPNGTTTVWSNVTISGACTRDKAGVGLTMALSRCGNIIIVGSLPILPGGMPTSSASNTSLDSPQMHNPKTPELPMTIFQHVLKALYV